MSPLQLCSASLSCCNRSGVGGTSSAAAAETDRINREAEMARREFMRKLEENERKEKEKDNSKNK
jgi:hypothetical protein